MNGCGTGVCASPLGCTCCTLLLQAPPIAAKLRPQPDALPPAVMLGSEPPLAHASVLSVKQWTPTCVATARQAPRLAQLSQHVRMPSHRLAGTRIITPVHACAGECRLASVMHAHLCEFGHPCTFAGRSTCVRVCVRTHVFMNWCNHACAHWFVQKLVRVYKRALLLQAPPIAAKPRRQPDVLQPVATLVSAPQLAHA